MKLDALSNGNYGVVLGTNGLGIGVTSPSSNLQVMGNAILPQGNLGIGTTNPRSTLDISGTLGFGIQSVSANTTLAGNTLILADASASNITLTLPDPTTVAGRIYDIKKVNGLNQVRVKVSGSGNMDDQTNYFLTTTSVGYPYIKVLSNGTRWYVLARAASVGLVPSGNLSSTWLFSETSGNTLADSTGSFTGTLDGGFTMANTISGKVGTALSFDGVDDNVITTSNVLKTAENFSVVMWFYARDLSRRQLMFWEGNNVAGANGWGSNSEFHAHIRDLISNTEVSGNLGVFLGNVESPYEYPPNTGNTGSALHCTAAFSSANTWTHFAVTVRNMSNSPVMNLYINGALVQTDSQSNTHAMDRSTWNGNFGMGGPYRSSIRHFDGALDDVRIYTKELSEEEVLQLYSQ